MALTKLSISGTRQASSPFFSLVFTAVIGGEGGGAEQHLVVKGGERFETLKGHSSEILIPFFYIHG
jgi:hypothetical protein